MTGVPTPPLDRNGGRYAFLSSPPSFLYVFTHSLMISTLPSVIPAFPSLSSPLFPLCHSRRLSSTFVIEDLNRESRVFVFGLRSRAILGQSQGHASWRYLLSCRAASHAAFPLCPPRRLPSCHPRACGEQMLQSSPTPTRSLPYALSGLSDGEITYPMSLFFNDDNGPPPYQGISRRSR